MISVDDDIGENGRVSFHFGNNSNDFGPFQINRQTGVVTAVGSLDRETQDSYLVIIHSGITIILKFLALGYALCR